MLRSIDFENYRAFERYRLSALARVNLLVGKNNCGKTTVLEGVHLLASGGDPSVLVETAQRRGEVMPAGEEHDRRPVPGSADISHFFHGHDFGPDAYFSVRANDGPGELTVRVVSVSAADLFEEDRDLPLGLAIRLEGAEHPLAEQTIPVSEEGGISLRLRRPFQRPTRGERMGELPAVQFIAPDSLRTRSMSEMWNKVIVEGREAEVTEAMKILEPGLEGIFFLSGESAYQYGDRAGIVAGFESPRRRVPLGSLGDGMFRLLALSLSLIQAEGGILLVDEIDTGLHYSIMGDMWLLVVRAAMQCDVQVFATTHSSDCVRGLAWLCENHPDLREEVSLQKIEPRLEEAVALDAKGIRIADERGLEVR